MTTNKQRFRVFATCDIGKDALDLLRKRGYEVEVYAHLEPPPKKLILEKVRSGVDGLITTLRDPIDAEIFEAGKGTLKVVAQDAVGFDNINRADANRFKIPFTHTADVLTEATAEFALFILSAVARKLYPSERLVRENRWGAWHPYLPFLGDEVTGKTVAVIGTGRIGQAFIKKIVGFDVDILCYDPVYQAHDFVKKVQEEMDLRHRHGFTNEKRTIRYVSFEEALRAADFISLHVPLLREGEAETPTYHLINERSLRIMKPTAYLVNTSRGPVVDEDALAAALRVNIIAGAALDVYETEPLPRNSPLRDPEIEDRVRLFHHSRNSVQRPFSSSVTRKTPSSSSIVSVPGARVETHQRATPRPSGVIASVSWPNSMFSCVATACSVRARISSCPRSGSPHGPQA